MKLRSGKIIDIECPKCNNDCLNLNSKLCCFCQKKQYTKEKTEDFEIKIYQYCNLCKTKKNNVIQFVE